MRDDPSQLPDSLPLSDANGPDEPRYIFDAKPRLAVRMAWATGRPLLVVGEAGSGKTQLATALACAWRVPLLKQVVHAQTKAQDLMFHFDAVARLADAQIYSVLRDDNPDITIDPLRPQNYLRPGPLWWAWNWGDAEQIYAGQSELRKTADRPSRPAAWQPAQGSVVLIDEIDKAGTEVPEGLLEVLEGAGFDVPWTGCRVSPAVGSQAQCPPLVLITSNGARDLPAPFIRRCIVLAMTVPDTHLEAWLVLRARAHLPAQHCGDAVVQKATSIIAADRAQARRDGRYVPGVAEFLDLLKAVVHLAPGTDETQQMELLDQLAPAVTTDKGKAVAL